MSKEILIIIRHCGERTLNACEQSVRILKLDREFDLVIKDSNSFPELLLQIFSMDTVVNYELVTMIDADVVLDSKRMQDFLNGLLYKDSKYPIIQPLVYSKFCMNFRYAGVHVYRKSACLEIRRHILSDDFNIHDFMDSQRPETVLKKIVMTGKIKAKFKRSFVGFEDFEQSVLDLLRKGSMFSRKNSGMVKSLKPQWEKMAIEGNDFAIILKGVEMSNSLGNSSLLANLNVRKLYKNMLSNYPKRTSTVKLEEFQKNLPKISFSKKFFRSRSYTSDLTSYSKSVRQTLTSAAGRLFHRA